MGQDPSYSLPARPDSVAATLLPLDLAPTGSSLHHDGAGGRTTIVALVSDDLAIME